MGSQRGRWSFAILLSINQAASIEARISLRDLRDPLSVTAFIISGMVEGQAAKDDIVTPNLLERRYPTAITEYLSTTYLLHVTFVDVHSVLPHLGIRLRSSK